MAIPLEGESNLEGDVGCATRRADKTLLVEEKVTRGTSARP